MTTTKQATITPSQLKALNERAHEKARERRLEEARKAADQDRVIGERITPVSLDTAVHELVEGSTFHYNNGSVNQGLTEADIRAAYQEMNYPTYRERAYKKAVSIMGEVMYAMKKSVVIGTAILAAIVGLTQYNTTDDIVEDEKKWTDYVLEQGVIPARQAITEAYGETNEELRRLKLQNIVADFFEKRSYVDSSSALFGEAIANGVLANDLISIIDTVCPLGEYGRSCSSRTIGEDSGRDDLTGSVLAHYATQAHWQGKSIDESIKILDEAQRIIIERHKAGVISELFSSEMPGLIINEAEKLLKQYAPSKH